jgi:hypothetical protein
MAERGIALGYRHGADDSAALRTHDATGHAASGGVQVLGEGQRGQYSQAVGLEQYPGPDGGRLCDPLQQGDRRPEPGKRQGGRRTADRPAHDGEPVHRRRSLPTRVSADPAA